MTRSVTLKTSDLPETSFDGFISWEYPFSESCYFQLFSSYLPNAVDLICYIYNGYLFFIIMIHYFYSWFLNLYWRKNKCLLCVLRNSIRLVISFSIFLHVTVAILHDYVSLFSLHVLCIICFTLLLCIPVYSLTFCLITYCLLIKCNKKNLQNNMDNYA